MTPLKVTRSFSVTTIVDGLTFDIKAVPEGIRFGGGETSKNVTINASSTKREGDGEAVSLPCYWALYVRTGQDVERVATNGLAASITKTLNGITSAKDAVVIYTLEMAISYDSAPAYSEPPAYLAKKEILIVKDGANGQNAVRLDLSNQSDMVACDADGKVRFARTVDVYAKIYNGATHVTGENSFANPNDAISLAIEGATVSLNRIEDENGNPIDSSHTNRYQYHARWTFAKGTQIDWVSAGVNIYLTYNNKTYSARLTITRTDASAIYQLHTSKTEIAFNIDANNNYTPSSGTVSSTYTKYTGGSPVTGTTAGNIDGTYYIFYRRLNGSGVPVNENGSVITGAQKWFSAWGNSYVPYDVPVDPSKDISYVEFCLTTASTYGNISDTNIIDRETVPVVKSGKKGDKGDKGDQGDNGEKGDKGDKGDDGEGYSIVTTPSQLMYNPNTSSFVGGSSITFQAQKNGTNYSATNCLRVIGINSSGSEVGAATTGNSAVTISQPNSSYAAYKGTLTVGGVIVACAYVPINRYGTNGGAGGRGHTGRFYYYADEYSSPYTKYKMDDTQAPYVNHGTYDNGKPKFWMLDFKGEEPSSFPASATDAPTDNSNCWTLMSAEQDYYIAKAFFGDYAQFGSFIINGDWQISTLGTLALCRNKSVDSTNYRFDYQTTMFSFVAKSEGMHSVSYTATRPTGTSINVSMYYYNSGSGTWVQIGSTSSYDSYTFSFSATKGVQYKMIAYKSQSTAVTITATMTTPADYLWFDPSDPVGVTMQHFAPNFAVDGRRGYTYQKKGYIGGFTIGEKDLTNSDYDAGITIQNASSSPTQSVQIGADATDDMTGRKAAMVAKATEGNTNPNDRPYNTALYLEAKNATYNYAFHGNGNGVLNGLIYGFKTNVYTVSGSGDTTTQLSITDGATIVFQGSKSSGIASMKMPTLNNVKQALGLKTSTNNIPFAIELNLINHSSYDYVYICFYKTTSGYTDLPVWTSFDFSTSTANLQLAKGDFIKVLLTYDGTNYRANVIIRKQEGFD